MQFSKLSLLAALAMFAFPNLAAEAADGKARIDVSGAAAKVELKAGQLGEGVESLDVPNASNQTLAFQMPVAADAWKPMTFRLTPKTDGKVNLSLKGQYLSTGEVWVCFDALQVTGSTVTNGDFEEATPKKYPLGWTVKAGQFPAVVKDAALVKSGASCVKVSHGNRIAQDIDVKAGQEITISVQARLLEVKQK